MPKYTPTPAVDKPGLYMIYDSNTNKRENISLTVNGKTTAAHRDTDEKWAFIDLFGSHLIGDGHVNDHVVTAKKPAWKSLGGDSDLGTVSVNMTLTQQKSHGTLDKEKTKIKGKYIN